MNKIIYKDTIHLLHFLTSLSPLNPSLKGAVILSAFGFVSSWLPHSSCSPVPKVQHGLQSSFFPPTKSVHPSIPLTQQLDLDPGFSVIALLFLAEVLWIKPKGHSDQMLASCRSSCQCHSVTRWPLTSGPICTVLIIPCVWLGNPSVHQFRFFFLSCLPT